MSPPASDLTGRRVEEIARLGKRLVIGLEQERFVVCHLMIAGRLHWKRSGQTIPKGRGLAALDFPPGTLLLTEAGKKRRASLHLLKGRSELRTLDRGGLEVVRADAAQFATVMRPKNLANTGNTGLPLCLFAFGEVGLAYAIVLFAIMAALSFTLGIWMVTGGASPKAAFTQPIFVGALLGATRRDEAVFPPSGVTLRSCGPTTPHSARLDWHKNGRRRGGRTIVNRP